MRFPWFNSDIFKRYKAKQPVEQYLSSYFDENRGWIHCKDQVRVLTTLVHAIRPDQKTTQHSIRHFLDILERNPVYARELGSFLSNLFNNRNFKPILTDAEILEDTHFLREVKRRIIAKLLPYQPKSDTLEFILNQVFFSSNDPLWIDSIPEEELNYLFDLLGFKTIFSRISENSAFDQLFESIELLIWRINGRVMETEVLRMVPEYDSHESSFVALENELTELRKVIFSSPDFQLTPETMALKQFLVLHKQCEQFIDKAFQNSAKYGISMKVNQHLLRIRQQLTRLKVLLDILTIEGQNDMKGNTVRLAKLLIDINCRKNNVRQLINESTQLVSYEITQHTAKTGEHYITSDRKEYMEMLKASMGGGLIVGIMCIIKVLLAKVHVSDFGHAFLYSANYAFGFIAIYLLGFTLATKQPAMTAAAFINELKKGLDKGAKSKTKYDDFARLFARLFRSQFIAFVGNVIIAFPVALAGVFLIDLAFDYNIATSKADKLITDLSPLHSPAIFHAAIAGVFLFLSGIISGSIANRDRYLQVPYRIKEHPILKLSLGRRKTEQIAQFYEKKWAGIMSNLWFGVFMGSTASIGAFIGLDLDIRHITFASGNLALGLYGNDFEITLWMLLLGILGIGIIGLINFLVSFILSLLLAFRSRNIPFSEIRFVFSSNWQHFKKHPTSFFFPVENKKKPKESVK